MFYISKANRVVWSSRGSEGGPTIGPYPWPEFVWVTFVSSSVQAVFGANITLTRFL